MQCILTRTDYELFYGPGSLTEYIDQISFTCPYCGKIGLSEVTLVDHVNQLHMTSELQLFTEVICPICAVLSSTNGGDPNHLTDDLFNHINQEHLEPFSLESENTLRDIGLSGSTATAVAAAAALRFSHRFNINQQANSSNSTSGRGIASGGASLASRAASSRYYAFPGVGNSGGGGSASLSSFMRSTSNVFDAFSTSSLSGIGGSSGLSGVNDPIAELLSQLAGVRRAAVGGSSGTSSIAVSNLQQLQSQLSRERENLQQLASIASNASLSSSSSNSRHSNTNIFSSANKLINKIGSIQQQHNQQQQLNNKDQNSSSQNNLVTTLLNQTLEIPTNIFQQALPLNARDPKCLLSK
jgi:hypothetical protein